MAKVFMDRKEVDEAIGRGARIALSRFGAFVRQRDRTSLKYRKTKSAPGSPPTVHRADNFVRKKIDRKTGVVSKQATSPLRELIQFAFDLETRSVVIGPELFRNSKLGGGFAPQVIEEGGRGLFIADGKIKIGNYMPRPHTGPAFRAELARAPELIRDRIK